MRAGRYPLPLLYLHTQVVPAQLTPETERPQFSTFFEYLVFFTKFYDHSLGRPVSKVLKREIKKFRKSSWIGPAFKTCLCCLYNRPAVPLCKLSPCSLDSQSCNQTALLTEMPKTHAHSVCQGVMSIIPRLSERYSSSNRKNPDEIPLICEVFLQMSVSLDFWTPNALTFL